MNKHNLFGGALLAAALLATIVTLVPLVGAQARPVTTPQPAAVDVLGAPPFANTPDAVFIVSDLVDLEKAVKAANPRRHEFRGLERPRRGIAALHANGQLPTEGEATANEDKIT